MVGWLVIFFLLIRLSTGKIQPRQFILMIKNMKQLKMFSSHSNNNHFDSQLENMVEAEVQDEHYFSSCLSVRAPYFGALSDLPLLIFYTEKDAFRSSSHQQVIEPYTPKWIKNQMLLHFAH